MSLVDKLDKIRSPKLQNQRETAVVLSAVEDTLKDQQYGSTPTAYFAALLALLGQSVSASRGIINKELATSVVYLIDVVTPFVPSPLLRSKFSQILISIAPLLTNHEVEAPLIRSTIGCLESLLLVQDAAAWALAPTQVGPRRAVAGLLILAADHRPKVRKRAQDAITQVLKAPPPSPSLDHPAADMCAETAMRSLSDSIAASATKKRKSKAETHEESHQPGLMHALQVVKTIASASGGWPSKKIEPLCELLMNISRSNNEYLNMAVFDIFELVFEGMADPFSSSKLPRLMKAIIELRPSQNDSQLLPPWIAVLSRGYDVSAQIVPEDTLQKLPDLFEMISNFLASSSYDIRVSASECLISFLVNGIPKKVISQPLISDKDQDVLKKVAQLTTALLSVKYQAARVEIFTVISTFFDVLKWRSIDISNEIIRLVGELRSNDAFNGKKDAEAILGRAVAAVGPAAVLSVLPLNLVNSGVGQPGRAWLLPVLRDHVANTELAHFQSEFIPLIDRFQEVIESGMQENSMQNKILEALIEQIWALLPGYCNSPTDLISAFDQSFAKRLTGLLEKQTLRVNICKALKNLVETNQSVLAIELSSEDGLLERKKQEDAQKNIAHLGFFAADLLVVLFNIYRETLPQYGDYLLQCINAYLSITPDKELLDIFARAANAFETAINDATSQAQIEKEQPKHSKDEKMPSMTHSLMDIMITLSIYLPRSVLPKLFSLVATIVSQATDPQLQKKAYRLLPRLATSAAGVLALQDGNSELQTFFLNSASTASTPCRRDRLDAIAVVVEQLPPSSLQFIPSILSEVVISAKEVNAKARTAAFDLLVLMGRKMQKGGTVAQSQIPLMPSDAPNVEASLEEFFTMVSAGLVGSTPHMVSASITALTRILYEFHTELSSAVTEDLVSTMDLFLTSANREIVRSVLGFTKVAIISLPETIVKPRLEGLVRGLMSWSREHKAHFRTKVKHIFERMIRRFGFDLVERYCPADDKKFINNIRKTKERRKRKKDAGDEENAEDQDKPSQRKDKFESEYDNVLYGSDESSDDDGSKDDTRKENGKKRANKEADVYIMEDSDEPLDLLDRKALGHISTMRPVITKGPPKTLKRNKVDMDGKLIFDGNSTDEDEDDNDNNNDGDAMELDHNGPPTETPINEDDISLEAGINAYVDAIRGRDAVRRGRGGRLKFSNKRETKQERAQHEQGAEEEDRDQDESGRRSSNGISGRARQAAHQQQQQLGKSKSVRRQQPLKVKFKNDRGGGGGGGRGRAFDGGRDAGRNRNGSGSGSGNGSGSGSRRGIKHQQAQRRGLGAVREGRVGKARR